MKKTRIAALIGLCLSSASFADTVLVLDGEISASAVYATSFVSTPKWEIPDYVFEPGYERASLAEIESFVKANRHLPHIPSAREIGERGLDLAEMNVKLLKTVEELTLHVIDLEKRVQALDRGAR